MDSQTITSGQKNDEVTHAKAITSILIVVFIQVVPMA